MGQFCKEKSHDSRIVNSQTFRDYKYATQARTSYDCRTTVKSLTIFKHVKNIRDWFAISLCDT